MENKRILLPTKRYFKADEQDIDLRLDLEKEEVLLREGDMDISLNLSDLFEQERNNCYNYKVYGKIKIIFRNLYSGETQYYPLVRNLYLNGDGSDYDYTHGYIPYNEFAFLRNDVLREVNNPVSGNTLGTFTPDIQLSGYTGHTVITPITAPYQNWNLYLSYIYSGDPNFKMNYTLSGGTNYSFTAQDGIPFRVTTGSTYYTLTSPIEHGISSGEYLIISGGSFNDSVPISGKTFYIDTVGNETYNSEKYVIIIQNSQFPSGTTLSSVIFGKRCLDINDISGTTSQYYVHKHKTLTGINDMLMDKVGFESPIFRDEKKLLFQNVDGTYDFLVEKNRMESVLFDFTTPFTLTGITNNLGYTPTEIYVTSVFRNGNGFFNYPPKVGYKFNFHDTYIDQQFSGNTSLETSISGVTFTGNTPSASGYTFISGETLPIGTLLTGAFVEYNVNELKERIISESFHQISNPPNIFYYGQTGDTSGFSGATPDNMFGLIYQPHYRVKLRQQSPYIETSDTNQIYGLPENSKYFVNEGIWKWRDLYDHGYVDIDGNGTDFPFLNNCHAVKVDLNFYLRNEQYYINKKDGINNFNNNNNNNNNIIC